MVLRSFSFSSSCTYIYSALKTIRIQSIHAIEGREKITLVLLYFLFKFNLINEKKRFKNDNITEIKK